MFLPALCSEAQGTIRAETGGEQGDFQQGRERDVTGRWHAKDPGMRNQSHRGEKLGCEILEVVVRLLKDAVRAEYTEYT